MSHQKMVKMLLLPQRSVATIFWKLLRHHCKDISWSSLSRAQFWIVLHKWRSQEFTCSDCVGLLCVADDVSGSTWKIQRVLQPRCAAMQHRKRKSVVLCPFHLSSSEHWKVGLAKSKLAENFWFGTAPWLDLQRGVDEGKQTEQGCC